MADPRFEYGLTPEEEGQGPGVTSIPTLIKSGIGAFIPARREVLREPEVRRVDIDGLPGDHLRYDIPGQYGPREWGMEHMPAWRFLKSVPGAVKEFATNPETRRKVLEGIASLPEAIKVQQVSGAEALSRGYAGAYNPETDQESYYDPLLFLGPMAVASRLAPSGATLGVLGGPRALNANLEKWNTAKNMEKKGVSADDIESETGWKRDADGEWKFEMSDAGTTMSPTVMEKVNILEDDFKVPLKDAFPDAPAAKAYPGGSAQMDNVRERIRKILALRKGETNEDRISELNTELRDLRELIRDSKHLQGGNRQTVEFRRGMSSIAGMDVSRQAMLISRDHLDRYTPEGSYVHEFQHLIEGIEKRSGGASSSGIRYKYPDEVAEVQGRIERNIREKLLSGNQFPSTGTDGTPFDTIEEMVAFNKEKFGNDFITVRRQSGVVGEEIDTSVKLSDYLDELGTKGDKWLREKIKKTESDAQEYAPLAAEFEVYERVLGEANARTASERLLNPDLVEKETFWETRRRDAPNPNTYSGTPAQFLDIRKDLPDEDLIIGERDIVNPNLP